MSKLLKIVLIFIFMLTLISINYVFAENEIDEISENSNQVNPSSLSSLLNISENSVSNEVVNNNSSNKTQTNSAVVTSVSSLPEANLGLENILYIILIVIGILLILLAIAILIRLK